MNRVAVIAVHGIADQLPGDTVRSVADMLLRLEDPPNVRYSPCIEATVRISVTKVTANSKDPSSALHCKKSSPDNSLFRRFQERSEYVLKLHSNRSTAAQNQNPAAASQEETTKSKSAIPAGNTNQDHAEDFAHNFMRAQLHNYTLRGSDGIYETTRIVTQRHDGASWTHELHMYEMYWADLSRLGAGIWRLLGELYQLLFHFSSLGRHTVDFALAAQLKDKEQNRTCPWVLFSALQTAAMRVLTLPVPILNLYLLATLAMIMLTRLEGLWLKIAIYVPAVLLGGLIAWHIARRQTRMPWFLWLISPMLSAVLVCLLVVLLVTLTRVNERQLTMLIWIALAAIVFRQLLAAYAQRRPGADFVGLILGILVTLALVYCVLLTDGGPAAFREAALPVAEGVFFAIELCWIALTVLTLLAFLASVWAVATIKWKSPERRRARRAAGTAWISLSLPATLFLLITLVGYRALQLVLWMVLKDSPQADAVYHPWLLQHVMHFPTEMKLSGLLDQMAASSETPLFTLYLGIVALAIAFTLWGLLPAIVTDFSHSTSTRSSMSHDSQFLGNWLTFGYRALYIAAFLIMLVFPFFVLSSWLLPPLFNVDLSLLQSGTTKLLGAMLVGTYGGLLAFHGRLKKMALGLRPAMDAVLDVDNYLREHPRDNNPRARICARYVSLLRYICGYRDEGGNPYTGIIIVSHSQGTVITAELLRFLAKEPNVGLENLGKLDPAMKPPRAIPIYLITVGCPLRQLYGWRFPHLYLWARHEDDSDEWTNRIPENQIPVPDELNVTQWVNLYRSGDYVGRYLWRTDKHPNLYDPNARSSDEHERRVELCIGPGGHDHYFDQTATVVAKEFDRICKDVGYTAAGAGG